MHYSSEGSHREENYKPRQKVGDGKSTRHSSKYCQHRQETEKGSARKCVNVSSGITGIQLMGTKKSAAICILVTWCMFL